MAEVRREGTYRFYRARSEALAELRKAYPALREIPYLAVNEALDALLARPARVLHNRAR